jgi:hypothetical protein
MCCVCCSTPPPTWEYTTDEYTTSREHSLGVPPLSDMMEMQLADFYEG